MPKNPYRKIIGTVYINTDDLEMLPTWDEYMKKYVDEHPELSMIETIRAILPIYFLYSRQKKVGIPEHGQYMLIVERSRFWRKFYHRLVPMDH